MEHHASPAEELPTLYRSILDGVAELERTGERREALLLRREARDAYSASWDEASRRRLIDICARIERLAAGRERPRRERQAGWLVERRSPSVGR